MSDVAAQGRKIFFLNPPYSIKMEIIPKLQKYEYEVYTIDSYRDTKNLLRKNPNSILFINLDSQMQTPAWFNFIRSFDREDALATTLISILSERIKESDKEVFSKFTTLAGDIIDYSEGTERTYNEILNILVKTDAKGRRQYVRATVDHDNDASLFWNHGSKMHLLKLLDISSVGMAVKVPPALESQIIAKNFLLSDATMRLGTKQVVVEAVIYGVKQTPAGTIWILLLLPQTPASIKDEIRAYVSKTLENQLIVTINAERKDEQDYSLLNYYSLATKTKSKTKTTMSLFSKIPGSNI